MFLIAYRVLKRLEDSLIFQHVWNKRVFVLAPPNNMYSFPSSHNLIWKLQINVRFQTLALKVAKKWVCWVKFMQYACLFAAGKKGSGHQDVFSPWRVKRIVTKEGELPIVPLPPARGQNERSFKRNVPQASTGCVSSVLHCPKRLVPS